MKRKLRIIVALVMSLTMMFGMSTTAFAEDPAPDPYSFYRPERVNPSSGQLIYVACTDYPSSYPSSGPVLTFIYNADGSRLCGVDGKHHYSFFDISDFPGGNPEIGKVYLNRSDQPLQLDESNPNPYLPPSSSPEPNGETPSVPSCDHDFQWQTITSATATTCGTEGEVCSKCGATRNVRTKSPLDDWVRMQINNAKPGDVLKLNFGPWNSYPLWMMQMIADKPTVTYIFNYTYQGNKYEVTIKPGDVIPLDCDWYGPAKMPTLFDTVITKW